MWQPIATANTDDAMDDRIIVLVLGDPNPVTSARWLAPGRWVGGPYDNTVMHPTHWMPLPQVEG
jgi:hypothetical protein